jgi:hypothetical protein
MTPYQVAGRALRTPTGVERGWLVLRGPAERPGSFVSHAELL